MKSEATTITAYLAGLPDDRRAAIEAVLATIRKSLPAGYVESFNFGMIAWEVPLSVYPDTYNKKPFMYAALASQKNHMAVYLCNVYGMPALKEELVAGFKTAGKKLDMGSSCVRFKKLADLPLDVIARAVAATPMKEFVAFGRQVHDKTNKKK